MTRGSGMLITTSSATLSGNGHFRAVLTCSVVNPTLSCIDAVSIKWLFTYSRYLHWNLLEVFITVVNRHKDFLSLLGVTWFD